jgi:hypothetical protein
VKMMADLRWDGSTVVAQNVRRANGEISPTGTAQAP